MFMYNTKKSIKKYFTKLHCVVCTNGNAIQLYFKQKKKCIKMYNVLCRTIKQLLFIYSHEYKLIP